VGGGGGRGAAAGGRARGAAAVKARGTAPAAAGRGAGMGGCTADPPSMIFSMNDVAQAEYLVVVSSKRRCESSTCWPAAPPASSATTSRAARARAMVGRGPGAAGRPGGDGSAGWLACSSVWDAGYRVTRFWMDQWFETMLPATRGGGLCAAGGARRALLAAFHRGRRRGRGGRRARPHPLPAASVPAAAGPAASPRGAPPARAGARGPGAALPRRPARVHSRDGGGAARAGWAPAGTCTPPPARRLIPAFPAPRAVSRRWPCGSVAPGCGGGTRRGGRAESRRAAGGRRGLERVTRSPRPTNE
jgi:hypothetical protein